jgi:hypothetical protein
MRPVNDHGHLRPHLDDRADAGWPDGADLVVVAGIQADLHVRHAPERLIEIAEDFEPGSAIQSRFVSAPVIGPNRDTVTTSRDLYMAGKQLLSSTALLRAWHSVLECDLDGIDALPKLPHPPGSRSVHSLALVLLFFIFAQFFV